MKFTDTYTSKDQRFSIGIEEQSGQPYLSIPVSNSMVDYEEYYALSVPTYTAYQADPASALEFVQQCRRREQDALLILKPGSNRGTAL